MDYSLCFYKSAKFNFIETLQKGKPFSKGVAGVSLSLATCSSEELRTSYKVSGFREKSMDYSHLFLQIGQKLTASKHFKKDIDGKPFSKGVAGASLSLATCSSEELRTPYKVS